MFAVRTRGPTPIQRSAARAVPPAWVSLGYGGNVEGAADGLDEGMEPTTPADHVVADPIQRLSSATRGAKSSTHTARGFMKPRVSVERNFS
jgi:hypothetical protein